MLILTIPLSNKEISVTSDELFSFNHGIREILKRKRRFKLHIKMKNYLNTNKQQEEYFNQSDFHCLNTKLLLVKDFFKPVKEYSEEERFAVLGGLHNSPTF